MMNIYWYDNETEAVGLSLRTVDQIPSEHQAQMENMIYFLAEEILTTDLDFPDFHTPKKEIKPGHYASLRGPYKGEGITLAEYSVEYDVWEVFVVEGDMAGTQMSISSDYLEMID